MLPETKIKNIDETFSSDGLLNVIQQDNEIIEYLDIEDENKVEFLFYYYEKTKETAKLLAVLDDNYTIQLYNLINNT